MTADVLLPYFDTLESQPAVRWRGRVTQVLGNLLESTGPRLASSGTLRGPRFLGKHLSRRSSWAFAAPRS